MQFEPPIKALYLGTALHTFANFIPSLVSELIDQGHQLGILFPVLNPDSYLLRGPHLLLALCPGGGRLRIVVILCVNAVMSFGRALCLLEREAGSCRSFNHILLVNLVRLASHLVAGAPHQVSRGILGQKEVILVLDLLLEVNPQSY